MTSGSLDLELTLPAESTGLRPEGMTTITVLATAPDTDPIANTAVIDGTHFSAGDLPAGTGIAIDVLLHDVSNRLVGVGEAGTPVDLLKDKTTTVTIPVRRPFVYAASGSALYSFDPTLDPRDMKFQGQLGGLQTPQVAVSVGGDVLAVATTSGLQIIDTSTHQVTGAPIAIPGTVHDAAPVPGTRQVAVASTGGISIVDVDSGSVQTIDTQASIDRVAVGTAANGTPTAYGLVGRVDPPLGPSDPCTGSSSLVSVDIGTGEVGMAAMSLGAAVSAIAADPVSGRVYLAEPCAGKIQLLDLGSTTPSDFSMLERAALVAVAGGRLWAAGTHAAVAACFDSGGNPVSPCPAGAPANCPSTGTGTTIAWATTGAQIIVETIPLLGGMPIVLSLPPRHETMICTDDPANAEAQELPALGLVPVDFVILPGAQFVGLVAQSVYYTDARVDTLSGQIVLPCLKATTGDWMVVDMASSSIGQRVRTECNLTTGPSDPSTIFRGWACDTPPDGEQKNTAFPDYLPSSVGALFGAR